MKAPLFFSLLALASWNAEAQSKTHTPGAFDRLELGGSLIVQYRQGERDEVIVQGDETTQRRLALHLNDGLLELRTQGGWLVWMQPRLQLQVVSRDLKSLSISGAADFLAPESVQSRELRIRISGAGLARFDQLRAGQLRFSISGAGEGQFAGQAEELRIGISGKGDVNAEQLAAQRVQVSISGLGKAKVWALQDLKVETSGVGTVEYWGSPQVQRASSGVSTVNALGSKAVAPPPPNFPLPSALPAVQPTPPAN